MLYFESQKWSESDLFKSEGQHLQPVSSRKETELESTWWDPKDIELSLNRAKPGEILVEARRDSNVQIDLLIWV